jgi:hypothetical protein
MSALRAPLRWKLPSVDVSCSRRGRSFIAVHGGLEAARHRPRFIPELCRLLPTLQFALGAVKEKAALMIRTAFPFFEIVLVTRSGREQSSSICQTSQVHNASHQLSSR